MMKKSAKASKKFIFVTGTDTEVGKTAVSAALVKKLKANQRQVIGLKPVASGCDWIDEQLQNSDALALMQASETDLPYCDINPVVLKNPIAPHQAAREQNIELSAEPLITHCKNVGENFQTVLVEGAGGWRVPLNNSEYFSDIAIGLNAGVVLVVAIKLGCINHALLTAEAVQRDGLQILGWVANCLDEDVAGREDVVSSISERLAVPCLGIVPNLSNTSPDVLMEYLSISPLLAAAK